MITIVKPLENLIGSKIIAMCDYFLIIYYVSQTYFLFKFFSKKKLLQKHSASFVV